jgi:cytochrome c-type biogenesis protein CcmE
LQGKKKFVIGGIIILAAMLYLGYAGFQNSATYYYTVGELSGKASSLTGQNIRVSGAVASNSIQQNSPDMTIKFIMIEREKTLPVTYKGVVPDAFKAGADVVVEGNLTSSGMFQANTILTKCPSKYAAKE